MIIGIAGTLGAGKGENVWDTFARPCQPSLSLRKDGDKVYCAGTAPVPPSFLGIVTIPSL